MANCTICDRPIHGPHLADAERGLEFHPGCVMDRVPRDAVIALIGALALVLAPTILVWAG